MSHVPVYKCFNTNLLKKKIVKNEQRIEAGEEPKKNSFKQHFSLRHHEFCHYSLCSLGNNSYM